MFGFKNLDVWQEAIVFADDVYRATRAFPDEERYGLTSQMRRASVSVSSNIAEGTSRSTGSDGARFVEIAYGSTMEVVSQMHVAKRQDFLQPADFTSLYQRAEHVARMLSGLKTGLLRRPPRRR
jgi:four helix bundle protein